MLSVLIHRNVWWLLMLVSVVVYVYRISLFCLLLGVIRRGLARQLVPSGCPGGIWTFWLECVDGNGTGTGARDVHEHELPHVGTGPQTRTLALSNCRSDEVLVLFMSFFVPLLSVEWNRWPTYLECDYRVLFIPFLFRSLFGKRDPVRSIQHSRISGERSWMADPTIESKRSHGWEVYCLCYVFDG